MIACCQCGTEIEPDPPYNMCVTCLANYVDITAHISKQAVLQYCRNCERYLRPPGEWINATLESRQLLALCIKKLKGIKTVQLVDAGFIWTEPHSKRLKVKLTVSSELSTGNKHQQVFIAEFTVENRMCNACHRIEAKQYWQSLVQVRQRAVNKKTFYYLEQLIIKHKAHTNTLAVKSVHGGLDFYYAAEHHARKLVEFLQSKVPVRCTCTKRLVTHDVHNNHYYYKYTWLMEIAPVSKDSAVCLSKKMRHQLGNLSPICLIHRVSSGIHIIDPATAQVAELNSIAYFRTPFEALCNPKQLVEYIVMDIDIVADKDRKVYPGQRATSDRHMLCDIWLVRAAELGINENTTHTRSHLGHLLKIGDTVMGYNLREANLNNLEYNKLNSEQIPDIVLVRKTETEQQIRSKRKVQHLAEEPVETNETDNASDCELLDDLEEDAECAQQSDDSIPDEQAGTAGQGVFTLNVQELPKDLLKMVDNLNVTESKNTNS